MRKITSFLATLLLMMLALPASAELEELKYKTVTIGSAADNMTPDTQWYLVFNKREYTTTGGGYFEDKGAGNQGYMSAGIGVIQTNDVASDKAQFLVRFISTDEEGKYMIQFGTGNYLQSSLKTAANESGAGFFNVYNINGTKGHFGINVWNMAARVDQNGSGATLATWGSGEITETGGNNDFTIYPVEISEISELGLAMSRLNNCFNTYGDYLPEVGHATIDRGTLIGQYNCSDEDYNKFYESLRTAYDILSETKEATADEIYALIQDIESSYQAIMDSKVPLTIADGNYRIVSAMEWTNVTRINTGTLDENEQPIYEEIESHPTKAIYATLEGNAMWANIDSTDCRYLWQLTNNAETGFIKMMNIATDGILATCTQSAQAKLAADSETEMSFVYINRTEDNRVIVAMKPSTSGNYGFLHANGHNSGAGVSGNIVGWEASAPASQWILEPVSDEEVQALVDAYAPVKNHELLVAMFQDAISQTEAAIAQAKDESYCTTRGDALITSTDQFSSPFTDPTEGNLSNVLSDDPSTYWHSTYQGGNVPSHTHYFQVAFEEPIQGNIQCFMRRRAVAQNDHITRLSVYGANEESALNSSTEDGWTELGSYDLSKNASASQTVYSNAIDYGDGYQYIRFYIDATTNNRGYGHFATFQLYELSVDGNTQWSQMGEAATAIETALETAKAVDLDEVEMSDYETLKQALDAFKAVLVDPSALAAALEANKNTIDLVAIGDNPGFWSAESETGILANTIEEASAYLRSGAYTQTQVDAYTEAIKNGVKDLMASANPIEEGKWYAFKFDSEENYDAHQWSKSGAVNNTLGDLYDNYAAPANIVTEGEGDNQESYLEGFYNLEEVTVGQGVRFINEDAVQSFDQIAFRFVAQGDSAYVIQHKSGLYLGGAARSTNLTLGLAPALFNVEAIGYGKVAIRARNLKGESYYTEPVYLHAANSGHSLVTWNANTPNSNTALFIEPINEEDLEEGEDAQESAVMNVKPNSIVFMCYPAAFTVEGAELYAYQGAIPDEEEAHYAFNKIQVAEPGQPVLLVVGDVEDFDSEAEDEEPEPIGITIVGTTFAKAPQTTGGVHGTYTYEWVDEGTVVVGGGKIAQPGNTLVLAEGAEATDCTRDISANTGYIVYGENILKNSSVDDFDMIITAAKPAYEPAIEGDLNNDGSVDISDAVVILDAMASDEPDSKYDLNGDNAVDISDFVVVLDLMAQQ